MPFNGKPYILARDCEANWQSWGWRDRSGESNLVGRLRFKSTIELKTHRLGYLEILRKYELNAPKRKHANFQNPNRDQTR